MFLLRKDGQNFGPFNLDEIRELVNAGSISPDTEAAAEGSENWRPVRLIIGQPVQIPSSLSPTGKPECPNASDVGAPYQYAPDFQPTASPLDNRPPVGILLLTILYSLNALFFFFLMILAIVFQNAPKLFLRPLPQANALLNSGTLSIFSGLGAFVGIIAMALCALYIFVAYGIYNYRNWARIAGLILACLGILNQLQSCVMINAIRFSPASLRLIVPFAVSCLIIYYLSNPKTKKLYVYH